MHFTICNILAIGRNSFPIPEPSLLLKETNIVLTKNQEKKLSPFCCCAVRISYLGHFDVWLTVSYLPLVE